MNAIIITHTHTCLPFAELDEKTKGKVLENYRDYNTDGFDWWDCAYEDFADGMLEKGVEVDLEHTYFSLGYSQSDYAAITAQVVDIDKFLAELGGFDKKATRLIKFAMDNGYLPGIGCSAGRSSTDVSIDWDNPHEYNQGDNSAAYAYAEKVLTDFAESAESYFKDLSRELYKTLCEDYENLTSEEVLADSFDANDCVFEIGTGKMFHKD